MAHLTTPPPDDPEVVEAMAFYDDVLTEKERRETYRSLYRSILGWRREGNLEHLAGLAVSVQSSVVMERNQPGIHEVIRNAPKTAAEAGGSVPFEDVYAVLRGDTPPA